MSGPVWHVIVGLGQGGAEQLLADVLPRQRALGLEAEVVALKEDGALRGTLRDRGIPVLMLGGRGRNDPRPLWRLRRAALQRRPSLIHAHLARAIVAVDLAIGGRVPVVAHFHSLRSPRPYWLDRFERRAAGRAVARVAVSRAVAEDRARHWGMPVEAFEVVPNGIDLDPLIALPPPVSNGPGLVVGFLGRLVPEKGIDVLLSALALPALRGRPDLSFEIAGGPPEAAAALQAEVARRGLAARVRVRGELPTGVALAGWDLLVLPSRREGFGLVVAEAMAAARPVVATSAGGIPEVLEDGRTGRLVPPGDPEALACALVELVEDAPLRARLGAAGRAQARQRFDVSETARRWAEIGGKARLEQAEFEN